LSIERAPIARHICAIRYWRFKISAYREFSHRAGRGWPFSMAPEVDPATIKNIIP
jgi:hypothetical protein